MKFEEILAMLTKQPAVVSKLLDGKMCHEVQESEIADTADPGFDFISLRFSCCIVSVAPAGLLTGAATGLGCLNVLDGQRCRRHYVNSCRGD